MRSLKFEVVLMTDDMPTEAEVAEYIREAIESWGDDNRYLGNALFASRARRMDVIVKPKPFDK